MSEKKRIVKFFCELISFFSYHHGDTGTQQVELGIVGT